VRLRIRPSLRVTVAALVATGTVSYAAAATLSTRASTIGSGRVGIPACDSNGFDYTRALDASHNVTSVTVSGIDAACNGGTLQLALVNAAGAALGTGSAAVGSGGSVTISVSGTAAAAQVTAYKAAISG
jgi:hypothetical protein